MKITVMCLFRNSEKGLPKLFFWIKKTRKEIRNGILLLRK